MPYFPLALLALPPVHGPIDIRVEQRSICFDTVERPCLDEAFNNAFVYGAKINPLTEIEKRFERFGGDDGRNGRFSNVLNRCEAEADAVFRRREMHIAGIDVGRLDGDSHVAAFVDVLNNLVLVSTFTRQKRRHKVLGVARLQISRTIGQNGIRRRMRLVEAVSGKLLHQVEDSGDLLLIFESFGTRTAQEFFALCGHFFGLLLPHRTAQQIRLT